MNTQDQKSLRAELRERFPRNRGQLLPALHYVHHEFKYLPDWAMEVVSWHLGIPASEVYGAATSYTELRMRPPPRRLLRVCTGISCEINGAGPLLRSLREGVDAASTPDGDDRIGLEETPCAYLCGVAPVVQWEHDWHGRATVDRVEALMLASADQ